MGVFFFSFLNNAPAFCFSMVGFLLCWPVSHDACEAVSPLRIVYSHEELLQLNILYGGKDLTPCMPGFIPKDRTSDKRKIKRGRCGDVKLCLRRQQVSRTPLPSVILGNVQSASSKLDELQGNVRFQKDFTQGQLCDDFPRHG